MHSDPYFFGAIIPARMSNWKPADTVAAPRSGDIKIVYSSGLMMCKRESLVDFEFKSKA